MAASIISKEQVEHIAKLSKLSLTSEEVETLSAMFTDTLEYMNILGELDTTDTAETFQVTGLANVFQKVDVKPTTLSQEEALSNASDPIDNLFGTKAVL